LEFSIRVPGETRSLKGCRMSGGICQTASPELVVGLVVGDDILL